jgi:hypothetical protein
MLRSCSRTAVDPLPALTTNNQFPGQPSRLLRIPAAALPRPTSFHLPSITYPMLHEPTPEHLPNLRTDHVSPPSPPGPKYRPRVLPKSDRQQSSPSCTDRSQLRSSPWKSLTSRPSVSWPLQPPSRRWSYTSQFCDPIGPIRNPLHLGSNHSSDRHWLPNTLINRE